MINKIMMVLAFIVGLCAVGFWLYSRIKVHRLRKKMKAKGVSPAVRSELDVEIRAQLTLRKGVMFTMSFFAALLLYFSR